MASALATAAQVISMRPPRREALWSQFFVQISARRRRSAVLGIEQQIRRERNSLAALVNTIAWDPDGIQTGRGGVFQSKRKLRGLATLGDCEPLRLVGPRAQTILRA